MNLKKIISRLMVFIFLFSFNFTAFATEKSTKISKEEAIKIAIDAFKKYFDFELDGKNYESSCDLRPDYQINSSYTWQLSWNKYTQGYNIYINAGIEANEGKIINLRIMDNSTLSSKLQIPKYTEAEGQKIAEKFIEKITPGILKNTKQLKSPYRTVYYGYSPFYNYRYIQLVNGVEFDSNYIDIEFDSINGKVIGYSSRWDDSLTFPDKKGIINQEKALEAYKKELNFNLQYIAYRDPIYYREKPQGIQLVYVPYFSKPGSLDAKTGELTLWSPYAESLEKKDLNEREKEEFLNKYKEINKLDNEIDILKADEIMGSIVKDILGEGYSIDYISHMQDYNNYEASEKVTWSAQIKPSSEKLEGGNITIDAATGQLISLYKRDFYPSTQENFTPKLTWEKAYTKAVSLISKYFPNRVKDIVTEQKFYNYKNYIDGKEVPIQEYNFSFLRKVNNIDYMENSMQISINTKTGDISRISCKWDDDLIFPETQNIISIDNAKKIFFENLKPVLTYIVVNKSTDINHPDMKVELAYILKSDNYPNYYSSTPIDAHSGKLVNYNGEEITDIDNFYKNIKGHPYEKEINILAFQGIIDSKSFNPNNKATKIDLIKALVNIKGYKPYELRNVGELNFKNINKDDANYRYLQMAVLYGILKNDNVELKYNQPVTREEMIKSIIDITPYAKLAQAKGIFTLNYTDAKSISADKYGYIAIAKGLSIIDSKIKTLKPKENVTMAEFAYYLYNAMEHIAK